MFKIESNLKINGRHWGLAFLDGVAYTANVALAAKLLLKGYVVTDQPVAGANITKQEISSTPSYPAQTDTDQTVSQFDQPVAGHIITEQKLSAALTSPTQADTIQTLSPSEQPAITPAEPPTPKSTKLRKKAVTADAADKR